MGPGNPCGQGQRWRRARGGASPGTGRGGKEGNPPPRRAERPRPGYRDNGVGRARAARSWQAPPPAHAAESAALRPAAGAALGECPGRAALPARPGGTSRARLFRQRRPPRVPLPAAAPRSRPGRASVGLLRACSARHSGRCVWASPGSWCWQPRSPSSEPV